MSYAKSCLCFFAPDLSVADLVTIHLLPGTKRSAANA
jgi:hypothetical protein